MKRALIVLILTASTAGAQVNPPYAPDRQPGEGEGPFARLIIRGATLIDGTGAPPIGPVDIVIEDQDGQVVDIEVKSSATVTSGDFSDLRKLADACGKRFTLGLVLYDHDTVVPFDERVG